MRSTAAVADMDIFGLTCDSRRVEPGFLFAALPGARTDGRAFIGEAMRRGAAAVLGPPGTRVDAPEPRIPLVIDDNPRRRLALMAARFFAIQPPCVAAVTGTNGKTSVVWFLRQLWCRLGRRAASLGTLGINAPGMEAPGNLTTPDPVDLHAQLRRLARGGVECLAIEASSHGLAQHRLDGVRVTAAALTNLTRDHLDYHGSMAAYLEAKLRLFSEVMDRGGTCVLNADASSFDAARAACAELGHTVLTWGVAGRDIRLLRTEPLVEGQRLEIEVDGVRASVLLPLVGAFQAENALCALGLALASGADRGRVVDALATLEGAPGRVQMVGRHPNGAAVYVDYAHTPDALASVLRALRPHVRGRLVVVFGCGGERDPGKRPEMGRAACRLADAVIVTDDNPRGEAPSEIRRQVLAGCSGAREIGDRGEAIRAAVANLQADDLLVVAGKGHERGQVVGSTVHPFEDAIAAVAAIEELRP